MLACPQERWNHLRFSTENKVIIFCREEKTHDENNHGKKSSVCLVQEGRHQLPVPLDAFLPVSARTLPESILPALQDPVKDIRPVNVFFKRFDTARHCLFAAMIPFITNCQNG